MRGIQFGGLLELPSHVLVVAAHPDDEVLGAGATVARLVSQGRRVFSLVLGEGEASRFETRTEDLRERLRSLGQQASSAHRILGDELLPLGSFPDNQMDSVPLLDIVRKIEGVVAEVRPKWVFTHSPFDVNVDHRCVHEAVLAACRPLPASPVDLVACFPILSSSEWRGGHMTSFAPNLFFDVSDHASVKIDALREYHSEIRESPHPRSIDIVEAQMTVWGSTIGVRMAEAFSVVRWRL